MFYQSLNTKVSTSVLVTTHENHVTHLLNILYF